MLPRTDADPATPDLRAPQTTKPATVDPNRILSELENLLQRAIGARVQIVSELAPGADPVLTDKVQLEATILNLVVNARDAMSDGGRITIRTENVAIKNAGRKAARQRANHSSTSRICHSSSSVDRRIMAVETGSKYCRASSRYLASSFYNSFLYQPRSSL